LRALQALTTIDVDLYVQYEASSAPALLCTAPWEIDRERVAELAAVGVEQLLVRRHDFIDFSEQLSRGLDRLLQHEAVPASEKFALMQTAVAAELQRTLGVIDSAAYCHAAAKISDDLVQLLSAECLPADLFALARHDYLTFSHVTNVAAYLVILAERLGMGDPQTLRELAYGAMLHDFGKRHLPSDVLAKNGRLTADERALIETHPTRGYEELYDRPDLGFAQLMMIYQHHERLDGKGYPVGLTGEEIHPWARLLAVVDVFDAITAKRPYRQPLSIVDALTYQQTLSGTHFDEGMLECWISIMTPT
jgi:HD-GYP domain-containing protein (c-di-GMP phosphodiesterase class II)